MLRCATWLAPGLPLELFETVGAAIAGALGTDATLVSHTDASGPSPDDDPFARGDIDVGFLCAPSYRQLAAQTPPSVALAGAAPVFADARNNDRPVYFAELVVRGHEEAASLADLRGGTIGFNDSRSLSGLGALKGRMSELDLDDSFATLVATGGHRTSLEMLASGEIDAASIDSNTLLDAGALPAPLRVLETWGPFPVQPVVTRNSLPGRTRAVIKSTLLSLHEDPPTAQALHRFSVVRFAEVSEADYR